MTVGKYVGGLKGKEKVLLDSEKTNYWGSTAGLLGHLRFVVSNFSQDSTVVRFSPAKSHSDADMDHSVNWV